MDFLFSLGLCFVFAPFCFEDARGGTLLFLVWISCFCLDYPQEKIYQDPSLIICNTLLSGGFIFTTQAWMSFCLASCVGNAVFDEPIIH